MPKKTPTKKTQNSKKKCFFHFHFKTRNKYFNDVKGYQLEQLVSFIPKKNNKIISFFLWLDLIASVKCNITFLFFLNKEALSVSS